MRAFVADVALPPAPAPGRTPAPAAERQYSNTICPATLAKEVRQEPKKNVR
jgi:hypothetical protein